MENIITTELVQRMYSIVLYNLSPIQQGIQTAHAIVDYSIDNDTPEYKRWAEKDKTIIILNGGPSGKLAEHMNYLSLNGIVKFAAFHEPDLYNGVTAFCFLADERIWDREKYPDSLPPIGYTENGMTVTPAIHRIFNLDAFKAQIGGEENYLLKEFLSKFRLA